MNNNTYTVKRTLSALSQFSGPGLGVQNVSYGIQNFEYRDQNSGVDYRTDNLRVQTITTGQTSGQIEKSLSYSFQRQRVDNRFEYTNQNVVNDGRMTKTNSFSYVMKDRKRLSDAHEALKNGFSFGEQISGKELLPVISTTVTRNRVGDPYETTNYSFDTSSMRVVQQKVQRAADNFKQTDYQYDGWGNVTKAIEQTQVGTRKTKRTQEVSYYNTGNGNLSLGISGLNLTEPTLSRIVFGLPAATRTTYETVTADSSTVVNVEQSYSKYTSSAQVSETDQWTGSAWAKTQYAYDSISGEVTQILAPSGQVTNVSYNYPATGSSATTYSIAVTQKDVQTDGRDANVKKDLIKTQLFDWLRGNPVSTTDERGFVTTKQYDALGRVTQIQEPNDLDPSTPLKMNVVYDDSALTSTVNPPKGAQIVYRFDKLGRLTQVDKMIAADEIVTTQLEYNGWGDVTALRGPVDSKTDAAFGRTLANLVTTFTYDDYGRVSETKAPGANSSRYITYQNATNTATEQDELGNQKKTVTDWSGKTISQSTSVAGTWITAQTFYDAAGRTLATVDAEGNVNTTTYNAQGLEASVKLPARVVNGASVIPELVKTYDTNGYLIQTSQNLDAGSVRTVNFTNNALGKALTSEAPVTVNGSVQTIQTRNTYDELFNVTAQDSGIKNGTYHGKSWTYDSHNRRTRETDEEGHTTTYSYDQVGNRSGVIDPREGLYTNSRFQLALNYDQLNRLVDAVMPVENTTGETEATKPHIGIVYDGRGNVVSRSEPNGQTTQYTYTLRNQLKTQSVTDHTTTYAYDDAGRQISVTNPSGAVTYTEYDEAGRIKRSGNDTVGWTSYTYNPNGTVKTQTDGRGNTTSFTYNPEGKVLTVTDAMGKVTTNVYDRWNQLVQTTDSEGSVRTNFYDELGRLVAETNPRGKTATWTYDAWNNAVLCVDTSGTTFARIYDKANRLLSETATNGATVQTKTYTYDEVGDVKTVTDGSVVTTYNSASGSYRPNPYGLVTSKTDSFGSNSLTMQYRYDASQRLTGVTNPDTSVVNYNYNALNQITAVPNWISGNVNYDQYGRLSDYTLANGVKKAVSYDANDRLVGLNYTLGSNQLKQYALSYDLAGNIVTKNDNAYGYDQLNRLIGANEKGWFSKKAEEIAANYGVQERDYDGSKQIAFTLNPLTTIGLDGAKKSFAVDLGKVYGVSQIELLPNQANHRIRAKDLTIYLSKDNQTYTKTNAWVLDKKADGSLVITFNEILQTRYIKVKSIWDDRDLENVSVDKATFRNQVDQLIKVHAYSDSHQEAYDYDSMGNRTKLTVDGTVTNSTYFKNSSGGNLPLLANDGTYSFTYDDNGNRLTKTKAGETWNYVWDLYNRLIQVKKNSAVVANYTYDSDNLRVEKSTPTDTTIFTFGRSGAVTYQKNLTKDLQKVYTYMGGSLLGWNETQAGVTKQYFVATDHLGSVTQVTDNIGSVVWSSEYLPFGALSGALGSYDFDGIYAGHQNDSDVGLVYMWNRWQDTSTGTFISEDPARDGSNWYGYAGNSPLVNVDHTGLQNNPALNNYYNSNFQGIPMFTARDDSGDLMNALTGNNTDTGWTFSMEGRFNGYTATADLYTPKSNFPTFGLDQYQAAGQLDPSSVWANGYIHTESNPFAALFGLTHDTSASTIGPQLGSGSGMNAEKIGENMIANVHGGLFAGKPGFNFRGNDGPTVNFYVGFNWSSNGATFGVNANFTLGQEYSIGAYASYQGKADWGGGFLSGVAYASFSYGWFGYYGGAIATLQTGYQIDAYVQSLGSLGINSGIGTGQVRTDVFGRPDLSNTNWTASLTGVPGWAGIGIGGIGVGLNSTGFKFPGLGASSTPTITVSNEEADSYASWGSLGSMF